MRIISDSRAQFKITINPYLGEIEIYHPKTKKYTYWYFDELDEWMVEVFDGVEYQFHFMYDEVEATYVRDGKYQDVPINLDIKI